MGLNGAVTRESWLENKKGMNKTERTIKTYQAVIKSWDLFLLEQNKKEADVIDEMKRNNQSPDTYFFLRAYGIFLMRKGLSTKSIKVYLTALRSWLFENGVMIYNEFFKRYIEFKIQKELRVALTLDQIKELYEQTNSTRMKAILLVLMSSGMRISEVLQLKVADIDMNTDPISIRIRANTTKSKEERIAFISKEAGVLVQTLLKKLDKNDFVFCKNYGVDTLIAVETMFGRLRKKCGFTSKYDGGRNYHVNLHSYRAYFHTKASKILGSDTAHAMIGHHQYMDVYFRLEPQERMALYKKIESSVTLSV